MEGYSVSDHSKRDAYVAQQSGLFDELADGLRLMISEEQGAPAGPIVEDWISSLQDAARLMIGNSYMAGVADTLNENILGLQVDEAFQHHCE